MSSEAPQNEASLRHLVSIADLSKQDVWRIFELAREIKEDLKASFAQRRLPRHRLPGEVLAMLFEKPSLRTRCTFETGMIQLGGDSIFLAPTDIGLGTREPVKDVARNLSRWVQIIMARTFKQETVVDLAKYASIPVINGLSDLEHPCQALADFFTVLEHRGSLEGFKLAWVGDGFNVCHSLMLLSATLGTQLTMAIPPGYEPLDLIWDKARALNPEAETLIQLTRDPAEAVQDADAIYTDVWASMGQEVEQQKRRIDFADYQVNMGLVRKAPKSAWVMHDLPAHRGEEITDEVIESPNSIIFDQAENRLHIQKAILCFLRGQ